MARFAGFCGTSYAGLATEASIECTRNYYQETPEVPGEEKPEPWLFPTPGLLYFGGYPVPVANWSSMTTYVVANVAGAGGRMYFSLQAGNLNHPPATSPAWWRDIGTNGRARGKITFNEISYGVNGTSFFRLAPDGTQTFLGAVVDDGLPVTMAAGKPSTLVTSGQLAIASGGQLYIYNTDNGFIQIPVDPVNGPLFGADYVTWMDGYFIVLQRALSQFQLSALGDGTNWFDALKVSGTLGQADTIQAIMATQEYLYLVGSRRAEIWYNAGGPLFPFAIESGAFIEDGIGANNSLVKSHDSLYWVNQSDRGGRCAVRSVGLVTTRISTHAIEQIWSNQNPARGRVYATIADCITYSYIWKGHTMIKFIFPSADASWLYDATESDKVRYPVWTESTWTDSLGGMHACLERDHCYAYGQHIVGSGGQDGLIGVCYTLDDSTYYDGAFTFTMPAFPGYPITRDRIVRLPWNNNFRQFLDRLEIFLQTGVGLDTGQGSNPQILIRISRDGGETWGPERSYGMGAGGNFSARVLANCLGSYRDGAIWVRITDPVFAALIGADIYLRAGGS